MPQLAVRECFKSRTKIVKRVSSRRRGGGDCDRINGRLVRWGGGKRRAGRHSHRGPVSRPPLRRDRRLGALKPIDRNISDRLVRPNGDLPVKSRQ